VLLVAEANRFPAGQVLVDPTARCAEGVGVLSALRVLPCLQNLGTGSRLRAAPPSQLRAQLRGRGRAWSELGACTDNPRARRLYERRGYRVVGTNREPYASPRGDGTVDRGTFEERILGKSLTGA
jgi:ribosomal protein S18 acetylase RimI-like enzyme